MCWSGEETIITTMSRTDIGWEESQREGGREGEREDDSPYRAVLSAALQCEDVVLGHCEDTVLLVKPETDSLTTAVQLPS